nr:hypothetical protein [Tanacetum cinerariifolium]
MVEGVGRVSGTKVVTKGCPKALELKGGDGGACKVLGWLVGDVMEVLELWGTAKAKTVNRERQIQSLVDKMKVVITESSVRSDLKLEDAEGTECLPNDVIFEQLTIMSVKTIAWNKFSSTMASAIIYLATNQKFNFSKYIFDNIVKNLEGGVKFLMYPSFVQVFLDKLVEGISKHKRIYVTPSHNKKLFTNMKRPRKGFSGRVTPLFQTMMVQAPKAVGQGFLNTNISQAAEIATLKERVKKIEKKISLGASEDASKQGRKIANIDVDAEVTLVDETQGMNDDNLMFDTGVLDMAEKEVDMANKDVSTVDSVTTAAKLKVVTTATTIITPINTRPKAKRVVMQEPSETTTTTVSIPSKVQDNRKGIMVEELLKMKKKDQIMADKEVARNLEAKLQAELEEEERMLFDKEIKRVNSFVPMDSEVVKGSKTRTEGSSKRAEDKLKSDNSKKIDEHVEAKVDDDQEEAEMKKHMEIVLDENEVVVDPIPLATKPPIIID